MKHPNQATLALHAGGDLGPFARWRMERHLAKCERCGEEVAAFDSHARDRRRELSEIPEVPWNRLAAEMKANIRLGLAAGECVRVGETPLRERPLFTGVRAAVALASIVALAVTGLVLEPRIGERRMDRTHGGARESTNGIEVGGGGRAFRLMNTGATDVTLFGGRARLHGGSLRGSQNGLRDDQ